MVHDDWSLMIIIRKNIYSGYTYDYIMMIHDDR